MRNASPRKKLALEKKDNAKKATKNQRNIRKRELWDEKIKCFILSDEVSR